MSLLCLNCDEQIGFGTPLHAVTSRESNKYSAICNDCFNAIPESDKIDINNAKFLDQFLILVCLAVSSENPNGAYTLSCFVCGSIVFGVSPDVIEKLLPNVADEYCVIRPHCVLYKE